MEEALKELEFTGDRFHLVVEHLGVWLDKAKGDPKVAALMLYVLERHLPHHKLQKFEE